MKLHINRVLILALGAPLLLSGCASLGSSVADVGLASVGGVAGYQLSGGKVGGAALGVGAGYLASKFAQSQVQQLTSDAEKRGYERAMNQAVKQQYWIKQNDQRAPESPPPRLVPLQIPAQTVGGVITNPKTEYIFVQP